MLKGDILVPMRGSEGASLTVEFVAVEVVDEDVEVESASSSQVPSIRDYGDASEDGLERGVGDLGAESGNPGEEANDQQGLVMEKSQQPRVLGRQCILANRQPRRQK